jgi:hypothetical protein
LTLEIDETFQAGASVTRQRVTDRALVAVARASVSDRLPEPLRVSAGSLPLQRQQRGYIACSVTAWRADDRQGMEGGAHKRPGFVILCLDDFTVTLVTRLKASRRDLNRGTPMPNMYVTQVLQPGETIIYNREISNWPMYIVALGFWIITVLLFLINIHHNASDFQNFLNDLKIEDWSGTQFKSLFNGLVGISLILSILIFLKAGSIQITVTDRRIIYKTGMIGRRVREIHILHIDYVEVRQSILGRFLGVGSIVLRTTGSARFVIPRITRVIILRQHIPVAPIA